MSGDASRMLSQAVVDVQRLAARRQASEPDGLRRRRRSCNVPTVERVRHTSRRRDGDPHEGGGDSRSKGDLLTQHGRASPVIGWAVLPAPICHARLARAWWPCSARAHVSTVTVVTLHASRIADVGGYAGSLAETDPSMRHCGPRAIEHSKEAKGARRCRSGHGQQSRRRRAEPAGEDRPPRLAGVRVRPWLLDAQGRPRPCDGRLRIRGGRHVHEPAGPKHGERRRHTGERRGTRGRRARVNRERVKTMRS